VSPADSNSHHSKLGSWSKPYHLVTNLKYNGTIRHFLAFSFEVKIVTLREALDILELNPNTLDRNLLETTLKKNLETIELRNIMRLLEAYRKANAFINPTLATHGDVRVTMIDEPTTDGPPLNQRPAAKRLTDDSNQRLKRDFVPGSTFDDSMLKIPQGLNAPTLQDISAFLTQEILPSERSATATSEQKQKNNVLITPSDKPVESKGVSILWLGLTAALGAAAAFFVIAPALSAFIFPNSTDSTAQTPPALITPAQQNISKPNLTPDTSSNPTPDAIALDTQKLATQKAEAEKLEAQKLEAQKAETQKLEAEKLAAQKLEAQKLEPEKLATQKLEAQKLATQKLEAQKLAAQKLEAQKAEAQKLEAQKAEAQKLEAAKLATQKLEAQNLEAEKLATQKLEAQKLAAQKLEAQKLEAQKLEAQKLAAQKAEARKLAAQKAEAQKLAAQKLETQRQANQAAPNQQLIAQRQLEARREAARLEAQREAARLEARREAARLEAQREAARLEATRLARQAEQRRAAQIAQRAKQQAAARVSTRSVNQGTFNAWDRVGAVLRYSSWSAVPDSIRALPAAQFRAQVYVASSPATLPGLPR
jgi:hypothetical protein